MTFIKKGWGFHVGYDFARAVEDMPIEITDNDLPGRKVAGHVAGNPKSPLGFMRGEKVRVIVDRRAITTP